MCTTDPTVDTPADRLPASWNTFDDTGHPFVDVDLPDYLCGSPTPTLAAASRQPIALPLCTPPCEANSNAHTRSAHASPAAIAAIGSRYTGLDLRKRHLTKEGL